LNLVSELFELVSELDSIKTVQQIEPIEKGYSHTCFKIITAEKSYFAKYFLPNSSTHQIELVVSKLLSKDEIAPYVIFNNTNWLICQYINARKQSNSPCDTAFNHQCLTSMIELHETKPPAEITLPRLALKNTVSALYQSPSFNTAQKIFLDELVASLFEKELKEEAKLENYVICHCDLNYDNFLFDKEKVYLIDFECSHMALPEFDLAMFFAINQIPISTHVQYLEYYSKHTKSGKKIDTNMVTRYLCLCYLINGLWYYDKSQKNSNKILIEKAVSQFIAFDALKIHSKSLIKQMR